jgi:drug/metabolite transporter (DMT)-like permease
MKRALIVYTPYQIGALRIFVACLFMLPFIVRHFGMIEKSKWKYLIGTGLFGNALPSILFPLAETQLSSAVAGMINSLTPIFTLIVGVVFFGMKVGQNRLAGLAIGLFGATLLVFGRSGGSVISDTNIYALYVVLATIFYAISVNILRYKLNNIDSIKNTGFALFFTGIPMGIYLFSTDFISRTNTVSGSGFGLLCIIILGLLATALSTILFNKLIKISGALSASSVTYLIPIVAVLWGIWDHEVFGVFHIIGMIAILFGVYLVNNQKKVDR